MGGHAMYGARADLYDRIYHWKDYAAEAARLRGVLRAAGVPDGARVVEAACGTGSYLQHLRAWYAVEGFDLSAGALGVARRKLPGVPLRVADMTGFTLRRPADVLVCLFSSFGYVRPGAARRRAAACFARAVRPGGVVVVEPWLTPDEAKPGHSSVDTYDGTKRTPPEAMRIARVTTHLPKGRKSVFDFHILVATPTGVEHLVDHHELWMETPEELLATFRRAGLDAQWIRPGPLSGRGVLLARRPGPATAGTTRSTSPASSAATSRGRSRRRGRRAPGT